ncbi:unnamed protein product [Mytilus coruscus]|uniref:Uncharacterized protein n=1 Tax=Mytilus coruscus TaxID=42192 RepID=A0A6J8DZ73_MYTCO|nr:unnamed protein product [Mytilus coruscus]
MSNILVVLTSKWFLMVILLFILSSLAHSISEDEGEAAKLGLKLGQKLAKILASREFKKSLHQIVKSVGPYLKGIGPFVGILMAFIPIESDELIFMKNMMKTIDHRLDRVDDRFNDIERLIKWNVVQINFGQIEQRIKAVSREFEYIYNVPEAAVQNRKELYIWSYKSDYQNSGTKLYQAIVQRQGTFQEDLGTSVLRFTGNNRNMTQTFLIGVMQLLLQAVKVEIGYLSINQFTHNVDYMTLDWEKRIQEVSEKFEQIDNQCVVNYHQQLGIDIDEYSVKNKGLTHHQFVKGLYRQLKEKYYWRHWIVISSDPVGDAEHCAKVSGGYIKLRKNGRNLEVASVDENHPVMDLDMAEIKMKYVPVSERGGSWWTGYKNVRRRAAYICNFLDQSDASLVSAFSNSASAVTAFRRSRIQIVYRNPYYTLLMWG